MKIELLAAGTKPPDWIATGINEYQKRLPRDWQFDIRDIPVARRRKGEPVSKLKAEEGKRMQLAMNKSARIVAMDKGGANWSTEQLASKLSTWQTEYGHVQFLIGGPDGLSDESLAAATDTWSLSKLTFPHFIVRVMLAEQIYRAWSVLNNHPYHK